MTQQPLTKEERDRLIEENGVLDLRARLQIIRTQRELQSAYRKPQGGGAA